jgi:hypothetical protein
MSKPTGSLFENLKEWILNYQGVNTAPHRFGGTEFQYNGLEFMHSHGSSLLDIRLSKIDQMKMLEARIALPHRFAPQAGWVSFRLVNDHDLENAKLLVQLAYDNAKNLLGDRVLKSLE